MRLKTWHFESAFVFLILATVAILHGSIFHEWIAALAVWLTFGHASISERMAERQAIKEKPDVECHNKLLYYFVAKEMVWVVLFISLGSYSSLAGCAIFLLYPIWRRLYRRYRPLNREELTC